MLKISWDIRKLPFYFWKLAIGVKNWDKLIANMVYWILSNIDSFKGEGLNHSEFK